MHTVRGRRVLILRQNKKLKSKMRRYPHVSSPRTPPSTLYTKRRRVEEFKLSETPGLLLWSERDTLQWRRVWKSVSTCWMPLFLSGTAWGDLWRPDSEPESKKFLPTASGLEIWKLRKLVGWKTFSKSSELTCPWFEKLESLIGRPRVDTVSTPRSC